jgi:SAM-dependent methyltransferase
MKAEDIADLYDDKLANDWNHRLLRESKRVAFEIKTLERLLGGVDSWLDVACGTGYFLSRFSGVKRAGFDISPSMVKLAQEKNPDAMFVRVADYRDEFPEWTGQWGLVSCMWQAYNYVNTMAELERVIANLARWTSENGCCFVPFGAPLGKKPPVPYKRDAKTVWGGLVVNLGVVWSWMDEKTGKMHENLIEPHPEHMEAMFRRHFRIVDVLRYPKEGLHAVVASSKKP